MDEQPNGSRPTIPTWVWIITVFALILGLQLWLSGRFTGPESVSMQELVTRIEQGQVETVTVVGDRLEVTLNDDQVIAATKHSRDSLAETLAFYGISSAELEEMGVELIVRDQSTWNNLFSIVLA
ncbi:MAG TPA: ATP-dependent metallopeptidase FtsH/Yme1/Tma family protein, partial [Anaerolineae bacterium]